MTPEEIENCWRDPENHRLGAYYCPDDPRIIVPRRSKWMGWTINFARSGGFPTLVLMFVWIIVPQVAVRALGGSGLHCLITGAASIAILCLVCAHMSSNERWRH